jgi:pyrimidine operon attenuation protein/uracil phosphoribosyltransferase
MHRDDFARRGLSASAQTALPFDVNGTDVLLLDDVLYTGAPSAPCSTSCSTSAGPPACGWRCWSTAAGASCPWPPTFAAATLTLPDTQLLALARAEDGAFSLKVEENT